MNSRLLVIGSLSALVLGGSVVGCTAGGGGAIASAGSTKVRTNPSGDAAKASKALARHDAVAAVGFAESAVAAAPRDAGYRLLLGQSYLQAGRFASARTAFADALQLNPGNAKAALNLALSQIATGDWGAARDTLTRNAAVIPATDRGLAFALAGDPAGGAALLTQVVRSPETSVKARQKLALVLALGGQWAGARVVASADMAPADVDARLAQWAAFAQPRGASDQVASLLGVRVSDDAGQPVALALNAPVQIAQAVQGVDVVQAPALVAAPAAAAPSEPALVPVAVAATNATPSQHPAIQFGPRSEVVQALPPSLIRPGYSPAKVALGREFASAATPARTGTWFVQIGAFDSPGVARDAWGRATRRMPALATHGPSSATIRARGNQFYRLSVGGFARDEADALCRRYRNIGGACYVRSAAGDQMAQWVRGGGIQLASR